MRVLIDACVLYPTVLREITLGCARLGAFTPLWSQRILAEWRHTAARRSAEDGIIAEGEIAATQAAFPEAEVAVITGEDTLWLPDAGDRHVLAAAIDGRAEVILTLNLRDFPARILSDHGLRAIHPDPFFLDLELERPGVLKQVVTEVHATAERLAGRALDRRALLKRARLPRLAKFLERQA